MLTIPPVHPLLMALLKDGSIERKELEALPHHSWKTIVEESIAQRIAALLFHWVKDSTHQHLIPHDALKLLTQQIVRQTAWNLFLTHELRRILHACRQQDIACIPIRGPMFAAQLYGDGSMRHMDDLDLLVHRTDLPAVKTIFDQLGYISHEQRPGFLEAFSYSLEFIHPQHGIVVEPHWTLTYPPFVDATAMEPVWARTVKTHVLETDIVTLHQADLLLHLCLHLRHKGEQAPLLWYYELDRLIRRQTSSLDWGLFTDHAHTIGQACLIADVLETVQHHFQTTVPNSALHRLRHLSKPFPTQTDQPQHHHALLQSSLNGREEFALLFSLKSLRSKIHYLAAIMFPSPQYMARRYGSASPFGLIGSYLSRICYLLKEGCIVAARTMLSFATRFTKNR